MTIRYMIATIPHVWKDMKELATTFFAVLTSSGLKCCQGKTESHHIVQTVRNTEINKIREDDHRNALDNINKNRRYDSAGFILKYT